MEKKWKNNNKYNEYQIENPSRKQTKKILLSLLLLPLCSSIHCSVCSLCIYA